VPRHKSAKEKDIWSASAGFPGIETLLPLLLSEGHKKRGIPLEQIVDVVSTRPARLFGLYPTKGSIEVGADADMVIVDLAGESQLDAARMHSGAAYTPYDGWTAEVRLESTYLRGQLVAKDGQVLTEGGGHYLPRKRSGRAALAVPAVEVGG
jgi:dihydropyrimidinase